MNVHLKPGSRAGIVAVGSELLTPHRTDTNSLFITARLNDVGIEVSAKHIVGDRRADLLAVLAESLGTTDLVVVTGGLGPTDDDITRTVVAEAVGAPLVEDAVLLERIRGRFASRGLAMPEINRRQALVPRGATVLPNDHGSAPGLLLEHEGRAIVLLPGPPREMRPMFEGFVASHLVPVAGGVRIRRRVVCIAGRTESQVDEVAQPVYAAWLADVPPIATSILSVSGQIELHLSVRADTAEEGDAHLAQAAAQLRAVLGQDVFSDDGRSLEQVVGQQLLQRGWRVAVAESCTGGLVSSRLTDVPGSSAYMERGAVCYSNQAKIELAGVPASMIEVHGAVSQPVAIAMAAGIRLRAGVEVGIGITGIAGPSGGTEAKPVGTVAVAVAVPDGEEIRTHRFPGDRGQIKFQTSQAALDLLRRCLERE
jgi:nicotinamide-nucleotide amidase